ncbi:hypothetical protein [Priestia megaterium]|uniref:hypothetical protein n=1 Tax=Priestia megaterium TaxID=1404 RepID=UPI00366A89B2
MRKLLITVIVLAMCLLGTGAFASTQLTKVDDYEKKYETIKREKEGLQKDNDKLLKQLVAQQNNQETKVKKDTETFLRALYDYDTSKGERSWTNLDGLVTDKAMEMLKPPGPDAKAEKTSPETTVVSELLPKTLLYYTPVSSDKANVFVRAYQTLDVNNVKTENQTLLDIQLIYDAKKEKWIVDDVKIQEALKSEGYVS